ncbi:MAG: hypothetical protein U0414_43405 [Polyangiaceae bacterium]
MDRTSVWRAGGAPNRGGTIAARRVRSSSGSTRGSAPWTPQKQRQRFVGAWETGDFAGLVDLLTEDAILTMPPWAYWLDGRDAVVATMTSRGTWDGEPRPGRYRIVPCAMNGQPAGLAYVCFTDGGPYVPVCMTVLDLTAKGRISGMHTFVLPKHFKAWGFPDALDHAVARPSSISAALALAASLLVAGCGATRDAQPTPQPSADANASATAVASASALPCAPTAQAAADELARLTDVANLQLWTRAFGPLGKLPAKGTLAASTIAEVRGYAFGFSQLGAECLLHEDGTFCSGVVQSVTLSPPQVERLTRFVLEAKSFGASHSEGGGSHRWKRRRSRCFFEPHHGFVFLDKAGKPLAEMRVCFTCGEITLQPAQNAFSESPIMMWENEPAEMRALCKEIGLGGCFVGDDQLLADARSCPAEPRSARVERALALDPGIPGELELSKATAEQRARLCAFYATAVAAGDPQMVPHVDYIGFDCKNGSKIRTASLDACASDFPTCGTVSDAVRLHRRSRARRLLHRRRMREARVQRRRQAPRAVIAAGLTPARGRSTRCGAPASGASGIDARARCAALRARARRGSIVGRVGLANCAFAFRAGGPGRRAGLGSQNAGGVLMNLTLERHLNLHERDEDGRSTDARVRARAAGSTWRRFAMLAPGRVRRCLGFSVRW